MSDAKTDQKSHKETRQRSAFHSYSHLTETPYLQHALKAYTAAAIYEHEVRSRLHEPLADLDQSLPIIPDWSAQGQAWQAEFYFSLVGDHLKAAIECAATALALNRVWEMGIGCNEADLRPFVSEDV